MQSSQLLKRVSWSQLRQCQSCSARAFGLSRPPYQAQYRVYHRKAQTRIPAAYFRGGTSRAVFFQQRHLPQNREQWAPIFRSIIGSPDAEHGRQLDGMGGGLSSLSKICVVSPSTDPDADVDYTFAAVGVQNDEVDYSSNCGNMSSAVGPFAVDAGLVPPSALNKNQVTVRIRNTNTGKYIHSTFPVDEEGKAASYGDFSIDGVTGTSAKIELTFVDPAGSKTGKFLPTGNTTDVINGVTATCIDVGNPCVFLAAAELDVDGNISPDDIAADKKLLEKLDAIRRKAGVKMGLATSEDNIPGSIPKIGMVSPGKLSQDGNTLESDITVRALSVGQPHKAVPITVALALASAMQVPGSTAFAVRKSTSGQSPDNDGLTIAHPTGKLLVNSTFDDQAVTVTGASVFRTARLLMSGEVYVRL